MSKSKTHKSGFTLLEILLVVGIIAILAGIVIVAINPSKQIATVRNTQRQSDIKQINSALQQYYITNGSYPTSLLGDLTEICDTGDNTTETTCTGLINLSVLVPTYLAAIPKDPLATTTAYTGYQVIKGSTTGLISLNAEHSELGQTIVLGKEAGGGVVVVIPETLGAGLIAHYLMNDVNCDTVADTKGDDGSGACTANSSGKIGGALSFDGNGSGVYVSNDGRFNITETLSISAWIYPTSFDCGSYGLCGIVSKRTSNSDAAYIFTTTGSLLKMNSRNDTTWMEVVSDRDLTLNTWQHVVMTYDSVAGVNLYIDAHNVGSAPGNGTMYGDSNDLMIGQEMGGEAGSYFQGSIDDVRIYNRVLNAGEISALATGIETE